MTQENYDGLKKTIDNAGRVVEANKNYMKNYNIVERLKKRIEEGNYSLKSGQMSATSFIEETRLIQELQKILERRVWTDKHTKIAKESNERFKSHTKDEEVDI